MLDLTCQRPASKALAGAKAQLLLGGRSRTSSGPVGPGAILCAFRSAERQRRAAWRGPPSTHQPLPQSGCESHAVANRAAPGISQAVLDSTRAAGANDKHLLALRCAPPRLPAETQKVRSEPAGGAGPTRRVSAQKSPAALQRETALLLAVLEAFVGALAPCGEALGTEETQSAAARGPGAGEVRLSWANRHAGSCTRQPAGEDLANGDVGWVVATATGRSSAVPRAGRQQSTRTCGLVHPALLGGAEPPSA